MLPSPPPWEKEATRTEARTFSEFQDGPLSDAVALLVAPLTGQHCVLCVAGANASVRIPYT